MATLNTIREALRAQPFPAFNLKLVDGGHYVVRHPDYLAIPPISRHREVIFFEPTDNGEEFRTRWIDLGLVSEVAIPSEPMPAAGPSLRPTT